MTTHQGFFSYLRGVGTADAGRVESLSDALGISPVDAKLLLVSRFPRKLSAHGDIEDAFAVIEKLRGIELNGFVVHQEEVDPSPEVVWARSAELDSAEVRWWHASRSGKAPDTLGEVQGRVIRQTGGHVKAIFLGSVRSFEQQDSYATESFEAFHIKMQRTRWTGSSSSSDRTLVLFVKGAGHAHFLAIAEKGFNFSCLGPGAFGNAVSVRRLASRLREILPASHYDESLLEFRGDMESSGSPSSGANFDSLLRMARLLAFQEGLE